MSRSLPNIIYIYADDLGRGMLSCYGQTQFRTPNIDRIAGEGIRFDNFYGCAFCAPARASLISGIHDAHAGRWSLTRAGIYKAISHGTLTYEAVRELINNTGIEARAGDAFLGTVAQEAGYVTGQVGKLEWGFSTTPERIRRHGWDYHYGFYDHERCHGFYPPFLFEDGTMIPIAGNTHADCGRTNQGKGLHGADGVCCRDGRAVFSQDLFDEKILAFLDRHRDEPFFLYHPSQLPHGTLTIPELDPTVAAHPTLTDLEKAYASMVLRLDRTVGLILDRLDSLGLAEDTLVIFAADNGHCPYYPLRQEAPRFGQRIDALDTFFYSDQHGDVFDGNDGMAGRKSTNLEGGVRIPFVARWPAEIQPGTVSTHYAANYDVLATVAEIAGLAPPPDQDGLSFLPTLVGDAEAQASHTHLVFASQLGPAILRTDGWKLRATFDRATSYDYTQFGKFDGRLTDTVRFQLLNVATDPREENDLSAECPVEVQELGHALVAGCDGNLANGTPQAHFAFYGDVHLDYRLGRG